MKVKKLFLSILFVIILGIVFSSGAFAENNDPDYLSFTAEGGSVEIGMEFRNGGSDPEFSLEYSKDKKTWTTFVVRSWIYEENTVNTISLNEGETVYLRKIGTDVINSISGDSKNESSFTMNGEGMVRADGNIMSLLDQSCQSTSVGYYAFESLFLGCKSLIKAPKLPATELNDHCYSFMFSGCTNLTQAPELPATNLADECYANMYYYCTNLTQAPKLPATNLADGCYANMFHYCTNLTEAPKLPATTLAECCYEGMFSGCTNITEAPDLPAVTLNSCCYYDMFFDCRSLTKAPDLPATTLARYCYGCMFYRCTSLTKAPNLSANKLALKCCYSMFSECTNLIEAPKLPATTLAEGCYEAMFSGCTSLTKAPNLPATTLAEGCYADMFGGCTSLTKAPNLPATTLAEECYHQMFCGCTNLSKIIVLPAMTLAYGCYRSMFLGCRNLTKAPELPATILAENCYEQMFCGCTNLTQAPELPATNLAESCYSNMFSGCRNLTQAPELPATNLAYCCYASMFEGCTNLTQAELPAKTLIADCYTKMFYQCEMLNSVTVHFTEWKNNGDNCTSGWLPNISYYDEGEKTFYCPMELDTSVRSISRVPEGWNIQYINGSSSSQYNIKVTNSENGSILESARIVTNIASYDTDNHGQAIVQINTNKPANISVSLLGFETKSVSISELKSNECNVISLDPTEETPTVNLNLGVASIKGPSIDVGDWSFPIFETEGGISLLGGSAKVKKTYNEKGELEKLSYVFGYGEDAYQDDPDKALKTVKELYNLAGGASEKAFESAYKKTENSLIQRNSKLGVSFSGSFTGFIECNVKNGCVVVSDAGFILAAKANVDVKYRIKQTADLVYVKLGISGDAKAKFEVVYSNVKDPELLAELMFGIGSKVGLGAGEGLLLNVEGGLEGRLGTKIDLSHSGTGSLEDVLTIDVTGGIYWKFKLLAYDLDGSLPLAEYQLYPEQQNLLTNSMNNAANYDEYELSSRDYLYVLNTNSIDEEDSEYRENNVYPYGSPNLVTLEDGRMMALWLTDDASRSPANRTKLVYAVRNLEGNWSEPQAVYDNGHADLQPQVMAEGNRVYVLWSNGREEFSDNIKLSEMAEKLDLVCSIYDGNTFSEPVLINSEGSEKAPINTGIDVSNGKIVVSWIENSANDFYFTSGTNTLYTRTIENNSLGEITELVPDLGIVGNIIPDAENGAVYYSKDMDGDPSTSGDTEIFYANTGNTLDLGKGQSLSNIDGVTYCVSEGILCEVIPSGINSLQAEVSDNYDVITQNGARSVFFEVKTGYRSEVYFTTETSNGWTTPVPYTSYDAFIRDFDAAVSQNGTILLALNKVSVNEDYDGRSGSPYGFTDLIITGEKNDYDISVEDTVYYDIEALEEGKSLPITIVVANNGLSKIESLDYTWKNGTGDVVSSGTIEQNIESGETKEITLTYHIPEVSETTQMTLTVMPHGLTSDAKDDNYAVFEYGYADLEISNATLTKNSDGSGTITATVKNNGLVKAQETKVKAYLNNLDGEVLQSETIGDLAVGESKDISIKITNNQMKWENECTGKMVYLNSETVTSESSYSNNPQSMWIEPVLAESLNIDQKEVSMKIGEDIELKGTMSPTHSVNTLYWVSSNTEVVQVDENGKINAVGTGTAVVRVITGDLSQSCIVTVEKEILKGDVDLDGDVDIIDARIAKEAAMKVKILEGDALKAGDLDGNGRITVNEARKIKRVVLGETSF